MGYVAALIRTTIKWAIYLAITGQLVDATRAMMFNAYDAQVHMISLSKLNRALVGESGSLASNRKHK